MAIPAKIQNEDRLGSTVPAPTKKATPFVMDVTVIETPYTMENILKNSLGITHTYVPLCPNTLQCI